MVSMPQNFDFGAQWATVVPHLLTTEASEVITTTFTYWALGRGSITNTILTDLRARR
jgi:hypothetical protein